LDVGLIIVVQDLSRFRLLGSCTLLAESTCVLRSEFNFLTVSKHET